MKNPFLLIFGAPFLIFIASKCVAKSSELLNTGKLFASTASSTSNQSRDFFSGKAISEIEGQANSNTYFHQPGIAYNISLVLRALYLVVLFAPMLFTSLIAFYSPTFCTYFWFPLLRFTISNSGAAFIKWGQWASTRSDMFPEALCRQLATLQSSAPTHSYYYTRKAIELEFGNKIENIFQKFERKPLASGSIAQVHEAVINGQQVAVKVRHPGVEKQIMMDFDLMEKLANWIDKQPEFDWLNLAESVRQFSNSIGSQTDLRKEGENLKYFIQNFRSWNDVAFPEPKTARNSVLIETFVPGESVAALIRNIGHSYTSDMQLAFFAVTRGEDLYLKMLLQDNFVHADLHPGNIIMLKSREHDNRIIQTMIDHNDYTLLLVDGGLVAELTSDEKTNFIGVLEAIGEGNGEEAADYILKFSSQIVSSSVRQAFQVDLVNLFKKLGCRYHNNTDVGTVLREILNLLRIHRVTIEANYATLLVNVLCLDGMAKALLPTYNVLDHAKVLLRTHRLVKRLPRGIANTLKNWAFPFVGWLKYKSDLKFLNNLKAKSADELKEIYNKRGKFTA